MIGFKKSKFAISQRETVQAQIVNQFSNLELQKIEIVCRYWNQEEAISVLELIYQKV